ncbi:MAG: NADPH-dependent glutamate synthase [Oscillospiraceae bacterium]|nr:NADPH-dependent glutamate synthase [Oscillospiraceae bacterium]
MADMSLTKNPMPEQDPVVRARNFEEVALGYTKELAVAEAKRCLSCPNPLCRTGCPVSVRIPEFIAKIVEEDFDAAYDILTSTNSLPAVCGRVCPQEKQCESKCVRGKKGESVAIGRLERFVADYHNAKKDKAPVEVPASNGHKVAVIGSGPSGLTCAGDLRKMGYDVTIFEAFHKSGGVLVYGIPQFRLPKEIVQVEIDNLVAMGVKIINNAVIGKSETVDELFEDGFEAVYIGSGAGLPQFLHIPGENLLGVYSANEILTRTNLMKAYRDDYDTPLKHFHNVAVIGGGNVAMDAARVAKRLGDGHVYITYRRGMDELPARKEEVEHAVAEGIEFQLLNNPVSVVGDENGRVTGIELIRQELGEPDEKGRRSPVAVEGSNWILPCDAVIIAIGTSPNPLIRSTTPNLNITRKGAIETDENGKTSREGIFCGGDAATGAATVILAMGAGKTGARSIDEFIKSKA